ncbi:redoxin domain-containing protein [Chitinophaga niabensis]|uniref:Peroxiredoxin n=1 Tax=Chitinophaga niabensis TaxID=536979 RepID=A0A1N6KDC3_9BACT|nr:redoxin domain-containing protein [Chitinophaga niabensis]SIO54541.1 Peroxiredoxin [Chitinophaga niabensis]
MKTTSFLPALLLLPVLASAQQEFTLKGKIGELNTPAKIYLQYSVDGTQKLDSSALTNGSFSFKGDVANPVKGYIRVNYNPAIPKGYTQYDLLSVYLEKGTIIVNSKDSLQHAVVKGPQLNKDNQQLEADLKSVNTKQRALTDNYYSQSTEKRKDSVAAAAFKTSYEELGDERKKVLRTFIDKHPKSLVALDALRSWAGYAFDPEQAEAVFNTLDASVRNSVDGVKYLERIQRVKATQIGQIAPDFIQNDTTGNPVKLTSFRGKYLLIDFWASWCGPCRAENPAVVKAYHEYKDKNFTILGVSLDQPGAKDKWLKAIADDKLAWTQVSDLAFWKNAVAQQYAINAIPQNFLLDPSGKIIAKNLRGEELSKKLAEVIH